MVDKRDHLRDYITDTDNEAEKLYLRDIVLNLSDDPVQYDDMSQFLDAAGERETLEPG